MIQSEIEIPTPQPRALRLLRAAHLGMCFGVQAAIALAHAQARSQPLTILGDLVHNETVLADLRARGIRVENRAADVATATVMITAHGASDLALRAVQDRGLRVLQATCPLVHYAHRAVKSLVRDNFHPVIVGLRGHVEVRGLTQDLAEFDIVLTEEDVLQLAPRPRFGIAAQTTQPVDRVRYLVEMARQADVVIVIGGAHSNNTRELAATCARFCSRVHQVASEREVQPGWLRDAETVGITAGTSTPDHVIDEVELRLRTLAVASPCWQPQNQAP